jgi:hypothetical protein
MAANEPATVVEKRMRFFDGQFLQENDFNDEQAYHLDRQRRHNRLLHVSGVAEGLTVAAPGPNQVTVRPGTAIDSDGRQLVLAATATVDLPGDRFNNKQGVDLYASYAESEQDRQTGEGSADFTRWLERPQLVAVPPGDAYAGLTPPVLLAKLALDGAGRVTVDEAARSYSGVRLPGPAADPPTLRSTAGGQVHLAGSLTVDGNELQFTTVSTIRGAGRLHITGEERLYLLNKSGVIVGKNWGGTGGLIVQGDLQAGGSASVKGDLQAGGSASVKGDLQADGSASVQGNLFVKGNVGVGTTAPPARLSVVAPGATEIAGTAHSAALRTSAGALGAAAGNETALSSTGLTVDKNHVSLGVRAIRTAKGTDWRSAAIGLGMDVDNTVRAGAALFLHANGNVGIGTTTPERKLTVDGELQFTGDTTIASKGRMHITGDEHLFLMNKDGVTVSKASGGNGNLHVDGAFSQASDARLKRRIRRLESTLDKLTGIRGVSYLPRRVGAPSGPSEERPAIGVIAQEIEAVFPELVSTPGGQSYKGVDYGGLTAVLLEAVKELKTALDPLQERVAALEAHS